MKILFIVTDPALYGANRSLLSIINYVQKFNVEIVVLVPSEGPFTRELQRIGIEYTIKKYYLSCIQFGFVELFRSLFKIFHDCYNFPKLKSIVKKIDPDIIYTNASVLYHGFLLSKALGKNHIWHLREFAWGGYKQMHPVSLFVFKKMLSHNDAIICTSHAISRYYLQDENARAHVIYNGIPNMLNGKDNYSRKTLPKRIKFLMVGYISNSKGQLEAIKAFEKLLKIDKEFELIIIGGAEKKFMSKLKRYCEGNDLLKSRISFKEYSTTVTDYYSSCDYFLMFSRFEAFGRVTVEAMQHGMPVIAFEGTATKEIVNNRVNGYLFNKFETSLTDIHKVLRNKEIYSKLSENAINTAVIKFPENKYCAEVWSVIQFVNNQKLIKLNANKQNEFCIEK